MATEVEEYSPERIVYWLDHWHELQVAAEGGTGGLNGGGAGGRDRLGLALLLADLEQAADRLPLQWSATLEIFRSQGRTRVWAQRRLGTEHVSVDRAVREMAKTLGWKEP